VDKDNKSTEKPEQVYSRKPVKSKKLRVVNQEEQQKKFPLSISPALKAPNGHPGFNMSLLTFHF
jgi:hypothetical protein